jgi:16S rRNA (uracil1498-N3)-methyltransferase
MERRFYSDVPLQGDHATLQGNDAHHLMHVLRGQVGDEVVLFDGSGYEFPARVVDIARDTVRLELVDRRLVDRELAFDLHLGVGLPKGDRQKWLVEKAVELGVTTLTPLTTARGVAQPVPSALLRLGRHIIEASKQCGRNRLLQLAGPQTLAQFVRSAPSSAARWIAHPDAGQPPAEAAEIFDATAGSLYCAIGPEGGFTQAEVELALAAGWQPLLLGPRILRVDTAVCAVAALAGLRRR